MACITVVFQEGVEVSDIDVFCKEIKTIFAPRYSEWGAECRGPFYHPREIPPSMLVCVEDAHVAALHEALNGFLCEDPRTSDLVAEMRISETNGSREAG